MPVETPLRACAPASLRAIDAFEDAGKNDPVINGEDQQDFLQNRKTAIEGHRPDLGEISTAHGDHHRLWGS